MHSQALQVEEYGFVVASVARHLRLARLLFCDAFDCTHIESCDQIHKSIRKAK